MPLPFSTYDLVSAEVGFVLWFLALSHARIIGEVDRTHECLYGRCFRTTNEAVAGENQPPSNFTWRSRIDRWINQCHAAVKTLYKLCNEPDYSLHSINARPLNIRKSQRPWSLRVSVGYTWREIWKTLATTVRMYSWYLIASSSWLVLF